MDVYESSLGKILEGSSQYEIPLYQRPYSWQSKNWSKLWDDIFELAEARQKVPSASHFTGTLVLEASSITTGLTKFLVVDGQQRLTTLSVLLAAMVNYLDSVPDTSAAKRIREQYLVNVYADTPDESYRLRPANFDEKVYRSIVSGTSLSSSESKISDAFEFFTRRLKALEKSTVSLKEFEDAVLVGLKFVTITAKSDDNVYRIFESINNTGIDLTQADLVRNLVFMRLENRGEHVYEHLWLPLVKDLEPQDVETVFWVDALWRNPDTRKLDVYETQKAHISALDSEALVLYLQHVLLIAEALRAIRTPSIIVQKDLECKVQRFADLRIPGALPLACRILYLLSKNQIPEVDAVKAFSILESYLVRRAIVAAPVASLGRITARIAFELDHDVPTELHKRLSTGKQRYVTDAEITRTISESPMYENARGTRLKLILQWLLENSQGKEMVDFSSMTIEHILPQTLTDSTREEFRATLLPDEELEQVYENVIHTLGNLTLTNYNSELSNSPFSIKREKELKHSAVLENQRISQHEQWGPREILNRSKELAQRAIAEWIGPDESLLTVDSTSSIMQQIADVVALIEPGSWTTYGDIAKFVGTAGQTVGSAVSRDPVPDGAWRVLRSGGKVSPEFRWPKDSPYVGKSCQEVLELEGVRFEGDRADQSQRLRTEQFAELLGIIDQEIEVKED